MTGTGLLLERNAGGAERRHGGRIAVARPDLRRRSDGFEIGLEPLTTAVRSPQSNGMAEDFVRTFKRDYVGEPCPGCQNRHPALPGRFDHYNELHPDGALGCRSPREFIAAHAAP